MKSVSDNKRTFWLVGASSGIGLALARELAKQGNYVFVSARSVDKLQALRDVFPNNIEIIPLDLNNRQSIAEAEKTMRGHTDYLDTLIACAGTCEYDDHLQLPADMYERITRVNYLGVVESVRVALPLLRKSSNRPHICAVGSLSSVVPFPRAAAYGASKAAVDYFMQSLKIDLMKEMIDVSVIRPGFVDTPLTRRNDFDMPFIMPVEDAVLAILKRLDRRPMFLDFPGKLAIPLKIFSWMPSIWRSVIAPKMKKQEAL